MFKLVCEGNPYGLPLFIVNIVFMKKFNIFNNKIKKNGIMVKIISVEDIKQILIDFSEKNKLNEDIKKMPPIQNLSADELWELFERFCNDESLENDYGILPQRIEYVLKVYFFEVTNYNREGLKEFVDTFEDNYVYPEDDNF